MFLAQYGWEYLVMKNIEVSQNRVLRLCDVINMLGISRSTVYEKLNPKSRRYDPTFPKGFKLSSSAVGWKASDIVSWIDQRAMTQHKEG